MGRPKSIKESLPGLMRIWQYFSPYVYQYRLLVSVSFLALLAEIGLRLLEPWPLKVVFDYVFVTAPKGDLQSIPWLDRFTPITLLSLAAIGLVAIAGLRAMAAYYYTVGFALVGNRVLTRVRQDLYHHLQHLSLSFHDRARKGDLVVRVISDVGMIQDIAVTAVVPLLGNFLILIGMLGVMFWINWQLTLLALLTVPLFYLSTIRISRRIQDVSRKQRRREGKMASTAAESLGAIEIVQALSLEDTFAEVFSSQNKKTLKEGVKAKRLAATLERTVDVLIALATALVLWRGAWLVLHQKLTPGDLLVFLAYLKNGLKPVQSFAKYAGRLAKASAAGERVLGIMEEMPEVRDLSGAIAAPAFQGSVQFDRVSFGYDRDRNILHNINFQVNPGQQVAIVGPSGSGKSTLASLLLRLYDPVEGRILIDGCDIRQYTLKSLRSQISVVLQESILFAATVRDNIAYGERLATLDEIVEAARLANASQFIETLSEGYDTILGERGVTISGGQRQRLAIARAFLRKSPILILDEPTTGLDKNSEREVIEALERLTEDRTTFIITHDLQLASRADLILYIEGGCILESGTHSELMSNNDRYANLYQVQLVKRQ